MRRFASSILAVSAPLFAALLCLQGCRGSSLLTPKAGDPCEKGQGVCQDATTRLACDGGKLVAEPCRGPKGCYGSPVTCDVHGNREGDVCTADEESNAACTDDHHAIECRKGKYAVVSCLAGCDEASTAATCEGRARPEIAEFCTEAYGAAAASLAARCSKADQKSLEFEMTTAALTTRSFETGCEMLSDAVGKKHVAFDRAKAKACARALAKLVASLTPLEEGALSPVECKDVLVGAGTKGDGCYDSYECKDGLFCRRALEAKGEGRCEEPLAAGETCERTNGATVPFGGTHPVCGAGLTCDPDGSGKCVPVAKEGEFCLTADACAPGLACRLLRCTHDASRHAKGEPCKGVADCVPGLFCEGVDPASSAPGKCAEPRSAGAACKVNEGGCKGRCDAPEGATSGTCVAMCGTG